MNSLLIREMRHDDVPATAGFPPPEWNFDATSFFAVHFGRSYFHPIVAETDVALAGIANALIFGGSAWLGNIIVAPAHRRQGLGTALTQKLIDNCLKRGCRHQLLIATEMGRPVYQALGFRQTGEYVFLKHGRPVASPDMTHIRPVEPQDSVAIAALDRRATAENRKPMLEHFLNGGMVHWSGVPARLDGFYLPAFGQGPVLADNEGAGSALLRFKHSRKEADACLPAVNAAAIEFLKSMDFTEVRRAPRMALGGDVAWDYKMVFARGAGYCG